MTDPSKKFPCTMCGACCRKVGEIVIAAESQGQSLGYDFPVNDDGSCGHSIPIIDAEGKTAMSCEIYRNRPDICRIELCVPSDMTSDEYHKVTAMHCNLMQEQYGIESRFRVKL